MTKGGQWRAEFVAGAPARECECDRPAVFDEGRCVKCGHRAEPAPLTGTLADTIARIITRNP